MAAAGSELSFFLEEDRAEAMALLKQLCDGAEDASSDVRDASVGGKGAAVQRLAALLGKYQEQATLLDPHLEQLVGPVMEALRDRLRACEQLRDPAVAASQRIQLPAALPLCAYIRQLCRVRGYKQIMHRMPHEVQDLELCLRLLQGQDPEEYESWEVRYVLLLWLSILCLVPFDMSSIDSSMAADGSRSNQPRLVTDIVELCKSYLCDHGPSRDAAAVCLAALLTRPDMDSGTLTDFCVWADRVLQEITSQADVSLAELNPNTFKLMGILQAMTAIFKKGHRDRLLPHTNGILASALHLAAQESAPPLARKLLVKLFQRIGLCYLPPRVLAWRYQRGCRSLLDNLKPKTGAAEEEKTGNGKQGDEDERKKADEEIEVPEQMDSIIEQMLCGLQDSDTVVRWSAAKGIGRIAARLPRDLADDVIAGVLEMFGDAERDSAWHGGCLALAELCRRGVLLPARLTEACAVLMPALQYDVLRGHHSAGAHVRDAACYVCWAFARAYSPEVLKPYVPDLCTAMLLTALFDREINCRRAASAAFQENVGRQGHENVPHGLEVIQAADYFALGNRTNAYLSIAPTLAAFLIYQRPIIDRLRQEKLFHWDDEIRQLAAKSLGACVHLDVEYFSTTVLADLIAFTTSPNLARRHGAVLGCAEVLLGLMASSLGLDRPTMQLSDELLTALVDVVPNIERARLYRGRGGETLRAAVCYLIECIARAGLKVPVKAAAALVESLNDHLKQPHDYIQEQAVAALRQMLFVYFRVDKTPSEKLQALTVKKYLDGLRTADIASVNRGYARALGVLPAKLALQPEGTVDQIIDQLAAVSLPAHRIGGEPDAETRRNALEALVELTERLGVGDAALTVDHVGVVLKTLLRACADYSTDKRGDVGSWCRAVALPGLERVLYCCVRASSHIPGGSTQPLPTAPCALDENGQRDLSVGSTVLTSLGLATIVEATATGDVVRVQFAAQSLGWALNQKHPSNSFVRKSCIPAIYATAPSQHSELVVPTVDARRAFYIDDYVPKLEQSLKTVSALPELGPPYESAKYIDAQIVEQVICAVLKQMAEKLDHVRDVAGSTFARLLNNNNPTVPYFPHRKLIKQALSFAEQKAAAEGSPSINWARPAHVFPFLANIMSADAFFDSILAGMVVAVGGLTESVSTASSTALLEWCRSASKSKNWRLLGHLASSITALFDSNRGDNRVIVPLLRTTDLLLQNKIFDGINQTPHPFCFDLYTRVKAEVRGSRDMSKINAATDALIGLFGMGDPARSHALRFCLGLLGHKFPKVRKHVAEQLYVQFLSDSHVIGPAPTFPATGDDAQAHGVEDGDEDKPVTYCGFVRSDEDLSRALDVLTTSLWDGDLATARQHRQQLADVLQIQLLITKRTSSEGKQDDSKQQDELDSYAALVKDAGY